MKKIKVISLIPSLTETLLAADVEVVGRTRFCVHAPQNISVVGGTKDIDWLKVESLKPDVLIFDKEENPKVFADQSRFPWEAIHVESIATCAIELQRLSALLKAPKLNEFSQRYRQLRPKYVPLNTLQKWVSDVSIQTANIEYVIWKDPLMAVSQNTFIGDVLKYFGHRLTCYGVKYPTIEFKADTTYLFSSEPYPFAKKLDWIREQNISAGLVDGEAFSWFGIRSLNFLEQHLVN